MSTLAIVLIVIGVLLALLFVGGYVANARRREAERAALLARAREADRHLAEAHAQDKGWERGALEAAAREAFAERHARAEIRDLQLVQVVDRPGTESDQAVFRVRTDDGEHELVLGRQGDSWVAV